MNHYFLNCTIYQDLDCLTYKNNNNDFLSSKQQYKLMRKNPASGIASKKASKVPELAPYVKKEKQPQIKTLQLPSRIGNKISQPQYKKIRQAFILQTKFQDYTLNSQQLITILRSLGVVMKTYDMLKLFQKQIQDEKKSQSIKEKSLAMQGKEIPKNNKGNQKKKITWEQFLNIYIQCRSQKGSYNQLNQALKVLDKQYCGNWDQLFVDLREIGDVLSEKQLEIYKNVILEGKPINTELLINKMLYQ